MIPYIFLEVSEFFGIHAAFKKRNFYKYMPRGIEDRAGGCLVVAMRQDFCPKLKMRRGV